jgi:putative nucleotidyltransferase with HDIG domain
MEAQAMEAEKGYYTHPEIEDMILGDPKLASLPQVYYEFRKAVEDPDIAFEEVGQIILKDPLLTARLLKIVNSAFYSFPLEIETISHASSVIGTEQLSYLILSTVVMDKFQGIPEHIMNMDSFWRHSIACGLAAKKLAEYKEEPNSEKHFIASLLHDIGRLVLCLKNPDQTWEILVRSNFEYKALHLVEKEELGFDHAQVGGALLRQWNLPQVYHEVAEYHHNPTQAPKYTYESSLCHLSDIIVNTLKLGCSGESFIVPKLEKQVWAKVELPQKINMAVIKDEIMKTLEETISVFQNN